MKKLAVFGAGVMGGNHIRVATEEDNFELTYVIDSDLEKAQQQARKVGARAVTSIDEMNLPDVDCAIVAAPSSLHASLGLPLLESGVHVLMEKPLSLDIDEAYRLKIAAEMAKRALMVGHIELFNPTIMKLRDEIAGRAVREFRAERLGYVDDHSRLYHGVVDDLMVHDIAIARSLLGNHARVVAGIGRDSGHASPDPAEAFVTFGDDTINAYFRASRVHGGGKQRTVEVDLADGTFMVANLLNRSITETRSTQSVDATGSLKQHSDVNEIYPMSGQPLALEHDFFARAIDGEVESSDYGVSAQDAIDILSITQQINSSILRNRTPR